MPSDPQTTRRRRHEPLWSVLLTRRMPKAPVRRNGCPTSAAERIICRRWVHRLFAMQDMEDVRHAE